MHQIHALTGYNIIVTSIRHVLAGQFHHQEVHSKLQTIHTEMNHIYVQSVHSAANTSVYVNKIREFPAFCDTIRHNGTPSAVGRGPEYMIMYTGCPRRNVPDFERVFLMLKYTLITQNTSIQSWTFTQIMARKIWISDSCYTLTNYQIHIKTGRNMLFL